MKLACLRVGFDDYQMDIYHIAKLFFEEVDMVGGDDPDAELRLALELAPIGADGSATVTATLERPASGGRWTHAESRLLRSGADDARRRELKRVVGSAMLRVLEEATGLEQPWGVLTGVRPTKLMHNLLRKQGREASVRQLQEEYLLTDGKAKLLADIAERQLAVIPDLFELDREVSLYIGIPFCPTKCAYCTFPAYDIRGNNGSVDTFLDGLHYEIRETGRWLKQAGLRITTIYWGGGTPTSITAEQIDALFETMRESLPSLDEVRELTVEAGRPDTITPEKLAVLKKWNVGRISINPQSFTQLTLDKIGRHHTVEETVEKFKLSREMGMDNINMDLIIGLPNEGIPEFQHTLDETAKLLPESLTVHTLSFKRASKMTKNRDQYEVAERDEIADMMKMANAFMDEHGYHPYYMYRQKNILGNLENVGYALGDRDSLYNILMMEERQTIIGLGCGAVSKVLYPATTDEEGNEHQKIERFPNPKEPSVYNQAYKEYIDKKLRLLDDAYGLTPSR
ncbi:coproporphyrinogen III oxidase [Paenibacillus flagellatus]|uniref:Coproporphyrinogen III oxidase n=1 Tax=Paenibacillus flagellatus TaxID=2211139 RepID=A0A2V5KGL2_9BACL|nr:coproporphyrinogen III oxidase [Paenibacillus flagellatus]PYI53330.1 coproporphyrinogen III oxidase [Paenibacillus flagellatus]